MTYLDYNGEEYPARNMTTTKHGYSFEYHNGDRWVKIITGSIDCLRLEADL